MPRKAKQKSEESSTPESNISFPRIHQREVYEAYHVQTIVEDQIYQIEQFLTPQNRSSYLCFFKTTIAPLLAPPTGPKKGEATRTNERFSVYDPAFAQLLFEETDLEECVKILNLASSGKKVLKGLNPNIRIYRYLPGAFFGPHYDDSVVDADTKWRSEWTLLIYLTEGDLIGGETAFHTGRGQILAPRVTNGLALLHKHGHDCLLHEGRAVKQGVKWVLRSDLMYA